jgi:hypothetical protein
MGTKVAVRAVVVGRGSGDRSRSTRPGDRVGNPVVGSGVVQGMRRLWPLIVVSVLAACTGSPTPPAPTVSLPSSPAGPTDKWGVPEAEIAALIARPMRLPKISPGAACPVSGVTERSPVAQPADARGLGKGPLYPITFYIGENATLRLGQETAGPDGLHELKVVWATTTGYKGPVVVRLGRIDGVGRGNVRLFYDSTAARGDAVVFPPSDIPTDFPSSTNVSGPGCYAYQIDGADL